MVAHRDDYGLEPICRELQVAPSAVRSCLARPISARDLADEGLKPKIAQIAAAFRPGDGRLWDGRHRGVACLGYSCPLEEGAGGWRVYEIGISYSGRTYEQGKKIGWKDGVWAVRCIVRYSKLGRRFNTGS